MVSMADAKRDPERSTLSIRGVRMERRDVETRMYSTRGMYTHTEPYGECECRCNVAVVAVVCMYVLCTDNYIQYVVTCPADDQVSLAPA